MKMKPEELYEKSYRQALDMIESGEPQQKVLSFLIHAAETAAGPDTVSSILVLDRDGLLRNGSSPRLPMDYLKAIDRLKPNAFVGTCASAAATGSVVITEDFNADDKWAELRHLPHSLGFKGAWSMPIKNSDNKVIGTFGTYFREHRTPTPEELKGIQLLASAAALLLSKAAHQSSI